MEDHSQYSFKKRSTLRKEITSVVSKRKGIFRLCIVSDKRLTSAGGNYGNDPLMALRYPKMGDTNPMGYDKYPIIRLVTGHRALVL